MKNGDVEMNGLIVLRMAVLGEHVGSECAATWQEINGSEMRGRMKEKWPELQLSVGRRSAGG